MNFDGPLIRVLLIDDCESDAKMIRRCLSSSESCRFVLDWVPTFDEALESLGRCASDLCLMDFKIGSHTGLDFLGREGTIHARLPLIYLTGHGNLELAVEAMTRGAIDYLDKSMLTPTLLERTILYAIENFRIRDALRHAKEELEQRVFERTRELERRNQELESFACVASHELQLPLKTITAHIEQMQTNAAQHQTDDLNDYFLHRAHDGARRMQGIISRVLDYARVGRKQSQFDAVDLNAVVAELMIDLGSIISEEGAQIRADTLPVVYGDPVLIAQLMGNLVGNALKYRSDAAPIILIRASLRGNEWCFVVEDNGRGIAPEEHEKVFAMFHRAHTPNATSGEGIGLALCKRIVEHHTGRIWVNSVPGHGSRFFFTLPASNVIRVNFPEAVGVAM